MKWRTKKLYPSLPSESQDVTASPSNFRLNRIIEIQTLLLQEESTRRGLAKKYRRAVNTVDGINTALASVSVLAGVGSVSLLATVIAAPVAVGTSAVAAGAGLICMTSRLIARRLEARSKKHDRIAVLARAKKNSIDAIVSTALMDNEISDTEFKTVCDELDRYQALKNEIRSKATRPQFLRTKM